METMRVRYLIPFYGKRTLTRGTPGDLQPVCENRTKLWMSHISEHVHNNTRTAQLTQTPAQNTHSHSRTSLKPHVFLLLGLPRGSDGVGVLLRTPHHVSLKAKRTQNLHYSPLKTRCSDRQSINAADQTFCRLSEFNTFAQVGFSTHKIIVCYLLLLHISFRSNCLCVFKATALFYTVCVCVCELTSTFF